MRQQDDVCAQIHRLLQGGGGGGVVHHQRDAVRMGHVRDRLDVGHVEAWVAGRLDPDQFGAVVDGFGPRSPGRPGL